MDCVRPLDMDCVRPLDMDCVRPLDMDCVRQASFDDDVAQVIYADGFGNLVTGIRWKSLAEDETIEIKGHILPRARTFCDVDLGALFVYENAVGLAEISANCANAQKKLDIGLGAHVIITKV
ncbi:MAG: SAM-dependent chlorinase/fluorinase [Magnetovibrio sp.]|nr:SAM-dependent chlorinase/fluorinase [Magnetovibrio sp.]